MNPLPQIAILIVASGLTGVPPATARAQEGQWAPEKAKQSEFNGRKLAPTEATADVSLRRVQKLKVVPGATVFWTFGTVTAESIADGLRRFAERPIEERYACVIAAARTLAEEQSWPNVATGYLRVVKESL